MDRSNEKRCTKCDTIKKSEDFKKNKKTKDGLCSWCKECHRIYGQKYNKTYQVEHSAKARRKKEYAKLEKEDGSFITKQMRERMKPIIEYCELRAPQCRKNGCGFVRGRKNDNGEKVDYCPFGVQPWKWERHMFSRLNHKEIREPVLTRRKENE